MSAISPGLVARLVSEAELHTLIHSAPAVVIYFSSPDCGICQVLKPRITTLLAEQFPLMVFVEVDCMAAPALAALHQVFSVPVVVLFLGVSRYDGCAISIWMNCVNN